MSEQRLTIEEVIAHCERRMDRAESFFKKEKLEEMPIDGSMAKEYWEHRQVREWLLELIERRKQSDIDHVRHGKWEFEITKDGFINGYACSVCGQGLRHVVEGKFFNYCPNCGAKMEGDKNV